MGISQNINLLDKKTFFNYLIILSIFISIFIRLNIKLNIIFGTLLAFLFLYYVYDRDATKIQIKNDIITTKKILIRPESKQLLKHDKLVNFIFSIQEFYTYNAQAYEDMIDFIDSLLVLYEESKKDNYVAGNNFIMMENKKKNALNSLHSIIYTLPDNKLVINKLEKAYRELDTLLIYYLNEVYNINKFHIYDKGYNNHTKVINLGPKPSNFYNLEDIHYDKTNLVTGDTVNKTFEVI